MLRRALIALITATLLAAACAPAALAASIKAKINSSSARVYNVPSTSSDVNVRAVKGVTVTVTGYSKGWARIRYKGNTGYMKAKFLNLADPIKAYAAKSTPVYKSASSSSSKLGTLSLGSAVYVVGKSGGYYRVENASGSATGYVKASNLASRSELMKAYKEWKAEQNENSGGNSGGSNNSNNSGNSGNSGSSNPTSKIDKVLALARSLVGRDYAISDNPPSSFNCSSFVEYCMEKQGFSMEGTAAEQAKDSRYARIALSDIRKGDILCFDTDGDGVCDHTAIYLGDSTFIEASQSAGKVQTNKLDSWYRSHFMLARRPS